MSSADAKPLPFVYQFAAGKSQFRIPQPLRPRIRAAWNFNNSVAHGARRAIEPQQLGARLLALYMLD